MPNNTFYTPPVSIPTDIETDPSIRSTWCCLAKGYTPPPFQLVADEATGQIKVVFEPNPFTNTCNCQIECTTEAEGFTDTVGSIGKFCPADKDFEIILSSQSFSEDTPTSLVFTFEDSSGNESTVTVNSLVSVVPIKPMGMIMDTVDDAILNAIVSVPLTSQSFVSLSESVTQYQIERYIRNETNKHTWVDWTPVGTAPSHILNRFDRTHWDRNILSGVTYGFRSRVRGSFENASQWSEWLLLRA